MKKEACFNLGKFIKLFGYQGELLIELDNHEPHLYEQKESIFVEIKQKLVPFFIDNNKAHSTSSLLVKLEDVDDRDQARPLIGKSVYLPLSDLPELDEDEFHYHQIKGFTAIDANAGKIGSLVTVHEQHPQDFFVIQNTRNEILIPVNEQLIQEIDQSKQEIRFDLPEGFLDAFTSEK